LRLVGSNHGSYYATADPDHMARLMAVAFGESELPLQQIRVMRTCRHSLDVAKKLDYFVWNLVQKGTTEIPDLILAKKQHRENEVDAFPAWPAETIAKFEAERAEQAAAQAMDVDESMSLGLPTDRCAMKALGILGLTSGALCECSAKSMGKYKKDRPLSITRTEDGKPDRSGPWVCKSRCSRAWREAGEPRCRADRTVIAEGSTVEQVSD
jgi:hypothetical protein